MSKVIVLNQRATSVSPVAVNYLLTINQLSARNAPVTREETKETKQLSTFGEYSQYAVYVPFILSGLIFLGIFIFQMIQRVKNLKNISVALVIAMFAASIPTVLSMMQSNVQQSVKASPEEIPKELRVKSIPTDSAIISWTTGAVVMGSVRIREFTNEKTQPRVFVGDRQIAVSNHSVTVTGLKQNHQYELEILSGRIWYDDGGKLIQFIYK